MRNQNKVVLLSYQIFGGPFILSAMGRAAAVVVVVAATCMCGSRNIPFPFGGVCWLYMSFPIGSISYWRFLRYGV